MGGPCQWLGAGCRSRSQAARQLRCSSFECLQLLLAHALHLQWSRVLSQMSDHAWILVYQQAQWCGICTSAEARLSLQKL